MTSSSWETVIEFTMLSITVLVAAYFTAAYATPILSGLGDLPSPESLLPTSEYLLADTFQNSAGQSPDPDPDPKLFYPGDQVLPGSGIAIVTNANLDSNGNLENSANQVASAASSVSDSSGNSLDASNTNQIISSTSLDPALLSPVSPVPDESKPFLTASADDASGSETPCEDSGTGSANKVRRGFLDWFKFPGNECPANYGTPPVPALKPKPERPQTPGQAKPVPKKPFVDPKIRKRPNQDPDLWYNPRVNGGRRLGGEGSCSGRMSDVDKPYTVVCDGRVIWAGSVAETVFDCQRCTYFSQSAPSILLHSLSQRGLSLH
ncbi:hypothetical protein MMC07_009278 [Pseudocyphellaria aurata]|nr:hypothetical protein [Pseudocyphellaria aurata]